MANGSWATDREQLLRRVRDLEEEVKQLQEKLSEGKEGTAVKDTPSTSRKSKKQQQRPFDFSAHGRRHVALRIAYLGWGYQGFASQENTSNTIEEKLFEALKKTRLVDDRQTSNYHRCGRTDKGVSAFGQVRMDLQVPLGMVELRMGLLADGDEPSAHCVTVQVGFVFLKLFQTLIVYWSCLKSMKCISGCHFLSQGSSKMPERRAAPSSAHVHIALLVPTAVLGRPFSSALTQQPSKIAGMFPTE